MLIAAMGEKLTLPVSLIAALASNWLDQVQHLAKPSVMELIGLQVKFGCFSSNFNKKNSEFSVFF